VITEVVEPHSGSSALIADLLQFPGEVAGLITDGVFHGALGVLTSVASHCPSLGFRAVGRGYAARWSTNQRCELEQSLELLTTAITETTTSKWVKEVQCMEREVTRGGGGVHSAEAEPSAAPADSTLDEGNPPVDLGTRLPLPTSSANADEVPQ
jgi:hypothetical protein